MQRKRRSGAGRMSALPEMETKLVDWIYKLGIVRSVTVSGKLVRKKAQAMYKDEVLTNPELEGHEDGFVASNGWYYNFLKRHKL